MAITFSIVDPRLPIARSTNADRRLTVKQFPKSSLNRPQVLSIDNRQSTIGNRQC
jgi:hypothetical protein